MNERKKEGKKERKKLVELRQQLFIERAHMLTESNLSLSNPSRAIYFPVSSTILQHNVLFFVKQNDIT